MKQVDRRDFLKLAGLTSASLVVAIPIPARAGSKLTDSEDCKFSHIYLGIGAEEGDFTFIMDKAEMGQGVITGQATMFCEELDLDPAKLTTKPAHVDEVYGTMSGMQLTGGSTSTPDRWQVLRSAGANIRNSLLATAAGKWQMKISDLKTENGFVISMDGEKRVSYNELANDTVVVSEEAPKLKSTSEFKYIGKYQKKVDAEEKSTGRAVFGIDVKVRDLLHAVVLRSPVFGGKLQSFDGSKALASPGIKHVVEIPSGVAVVGEKYWQVQKARSLVDIKWDLGANKSLSSEQILKTYEKLLSEKDGKEAYSEGDAESAFASDDGQVVSAQYELPYLAHSTMEPMNAAAHVTKDKCEIWTGTQGPTMVRNEAADLLGLDRDQVFVYNSKYLGGGFGRRSTLDYPLEAVHLSKKINAPVKVIWSREDDTKFSPMRPINRHHLRAKIKDGKTLAWEHKIGAESLMQEFLPAVIPLMMPEWLPGFVKNSVGSLAGGALSAFDVHMTTAEGAHHDYKIPNQYVGIVSQGLDVPVHFWRSVGHSFNGFVKESFADEVAHAANKDPYQYRRELLKNERRGLAVLDKVAKMANWGEPKGEGVYQGIAYHFSFESYVAQVAEVRIVDQQIKVDKVYCAIDCGIAINPNIISDQIESSIIYGLSAALKGKIDIQDGGVAQSNFHNYQVMRLKDAPEVRVEIIDSDVSPKGVGEPGLPPIAAAVGNAVFAATKVRLRTMPFTLS
jgi:isoquinoline 1-oxidoreductase beta subunit